MDKIEIRGARTHNLKDINLTIPRDKLTVITGLSGSGKSSLAFDTLYAEGSVAMLSLCQPMLVNFYPLWKSRMLTTLKVCLLLSQ